MWKTITHVDTVIFVVKFPQLYSYPQEDLFEPIKRTSLYQHKFKTPIH